MDEDYVDYDDYEQSPYYTEVCTCGEWMVGVLVQCDKHHGIGCYCNWCMQ